jgi:hypothetical protein
VECLVDDIMEFDEEATPGLTEASLCVLHDYVHYRMDTVDNDLEWEDAHATVEEALDEVGSPLNPLADIIEAADRIDPEERRAAFAATRVVAMVPRLLEWIGRGRATSPSGGVRRVDIAEAAAMLGVNAVGVNKRPPHQPDDVSLPGLDTALPTSSTVYAMSMQDVPLLASWWDALRAVGVIENTSTRVRPGPAALNWSAASLPPAEVAEMIIGFFVAGVLTHDLRHWGFYEDRVVALALARLVEVAAGLDAPDLGNQPIDQMLGSRVLRKLRHLEQAGLLEQVGDDQFTIPLPLRGAIARGLIVTAGMLEDELDIE